MHIRGKNITAGLLVSLISVALAIGITYIVASSASDVPLNVQTPNAKNLVFMPTSTDQPGIASIMINGTVLPTSSYNCVFPLETWRQFPGAWRINDYRIGDISYTSADLLKAMQRTDGDLWDRLLAQLFTAVLNQQNGADVTSVRSAFSQGISWMQNFPRGSNPTDGSVQQTEIIITTLTRFNQGNFGPVTCQYELSLSTAISIATLAPGVTPSVTPTPTLGPTRRIIMPTWTREPSYNQPKKPTKVPATKVPTPLPQATATSRPLPSATDAPPQEPTPIPTVRPPDPSATSAPPANTPEPPPSVGITPNPTIPPPARPATLAPTSRPATLAPQPTSTPALPQPTKTKKPKRK